jgi:hypothetical protein
MACSRMYERTDSRVNERNGSRPRILATQAGDIDLRIPKLRKGSFFPLILEPRRRIDQALYAVVMEAYVAGVSTRAVDDLLASKSRPAPTPSPQPTRYPTISATPSKPSPAPAEVRTNLSQVGATPVRPTRSTSE